MEKLMQSLFHFASLVQNDPPPPVSPKLDEFEFLQFLTPLREHLEPTDEFRVLLNVSLLEPGDVSLEVVDGKVLEVTATHGRKLNADGIWITRDFKYSFEIPEKSRGKALFAEWSEDEYLIVQTKSEENGEKPEGVTDVEAAGRIRLVPEQVPFAVRPAVELSVARAIVQDIRDKASNLLRYIITHTRSEFKDEELAEKKDEVPEVSPVNKEELKEACEKMECEEISSPIKEKPPASFYCA